MLMMRTQAAASYAGAPSNRTVYHVQAGSVMPQHSPRAAVPSQQLHQTLSQANVFTPSARQMVAGRRSKHHLGDLTVNTAAALDNRSPSRQRTPSARDTSPRVVHVTRNPLMDGPDGLGRVPSSPRLTPAIAAAPSGRQLLPGTPSVTGPSPHLPRVSSGASVTPHRQMTPAMPRSTSRRSLRGAGVSVLLEEQAQQSFRQPSPRRTSFGASGTRPTK